VSAPPGDGAPERARKGAREAYFAELQGFVETPVYERTRLQCGDRIRGPAIFEEPDSTAICPPGYAVEVDAQLNLVITRT
jgi:N-methylhydantoinase A